MTDTVIESPSPVTFSVANINPGSIRAEFMLSMMQLVEKERASQHEVDPLIPRVQFDQFYCRYPAGPYLDDERNNCVLWFLNHTASDYLVFIDSDIGFKAEQVYQLVHTAHDNGVTVLSGVYYNQFHGELRALIFEWAEDKHLNGARNLLPLAPVHLDSFHPQSKPHPIDACGAGFLAIHRSTFLAMHEKYLDPQPFFAELVIDGIHMGEDLTFCIRAAAVDHQPYVLPSIEVDHFKTCNVRRAYDVPNPPPSSPSIH